METKKRMIDPDALLAEITGMKVIDPYKKMRGLVERWVRNNGYDILIQLVKHFPAVEVAEVVHGHKIVRERHRGVAYVMECPICNSKIPRNKPYAEKVEYCSVCGKKLDDTFQNYCPNCGAKMDGGTTDG